MSADHDLDDVALPGAAAGAAADPCRRDDAEIRSAAAASSGGTGLVSPPPSEEDGGGGATGGAADASSPEEAVAAVGQEGQEGQVGEDEEENIRRLRESTARLGSALATATSDLDSRLGVSQSVRNLDAAYGITDGVAKGRDELGRLWSSFRVAERTGQVKEKAGEITRSVKEGAGPVVGPVAWQAREVTKNVGEAAAPVVKPVVEKTTETTKGVVGKVAENVERLHLGEKLGQVGQSVKHLDEKHKITAKTAGAVAGGMDLISSRIGKGGGDGGNKAGGDSGEAGADGDEKDGDGFPTSFRKEKEGEDDV